MASEIVDLPVKNGGFPVRYVSLPESTSSVHCARKNHRFCQEIQLSFKHRLKPS